MIIVSSIDTLVGRGDNRVKVHTGKGKYAIDYKDPMTALQLSIFKKLGVMNFEERVDAYIEGPQKNKKTAGTIEPVLGVDLGSGKIQKQETDQGSGRSALPERRDGDDKAKPVRRTRRKKKSAVAKTN